MPMAPEELTTVAVASHRAVAPSRVADGRVYTVEMRPFRRSPPPFLPPMPEEVPCFGSVNPAAAGRARRRRTNT